MPHAGGRPPTKWLRDTLSADDGSGRTKRERILDHLIEVATSWDVRIVGKGADGELLKVASGSDSVAAAKLIYSYDIGKPQGGDREFTMVVAEHLRQAARDQVDIALRALGAKAATMQPEQIAEFVRMCSQDARGFLKAAEDVVNHRFEAPDQPQIPAPQPSEEEDQG